MSKKQDDEYRYKKLKLKEILDAYFLIGEYISPPATEEDLYMATMLYEKEEEMFLIFYGKRPPKNENKSTHLLLEAFEENNFLFFVNYMLEIANVQ